MSQSIIVPENINALIFDCDGTLVDSMPLHMEAWKHTINKLGAEWDYDHFFSSRGMVETDIVENYNKKYSTKFNTKMVIDEKHNYFKNHLSFLRPIKPVVDIAERYNNRMPMSVVSGGTKENVHEELKEIGIIDLFDFILTSNNDKKPKPAPDLFLYAAELMNVQPEGCLVFEDGELGLQAAEKAGIKSIDVREYIESND